MQLGFVAGTIPVEKLAAFERLLFRATRGNMFLKFTPVGAGRLWSSSLLPGEGEGLCADWWVAKVAAWPPTAMQERGQCASRHAGAC